METLHIYTSKRYVLTTINSKYQELGDWKYFNIFVIKTTKPTTNIFETNGEIQKPNSYDELIEMLKDYDSVYDFYEVESLRHGEIAYDIIIEE